MKMNISQTQCRIKSCFSLVSLGWPGSFSVYVFRRLSFVTDFISLLESRCAKLAKWTGRGLRGIWRVKPSYPSLFNLPVSHLPAGSSHEITCKIEGLSELCP